MNFSIGIYSCPMDPMDSSSWLMSYSRSPSSLLRYPAAQPCFAASYLKFTRLAGIAHKPTTININHQSDSKNKIEFKKIIY